MDTATDNSPKLPAWLEELLPEPIPPHVLTTELQGDERVLRVTSPSGDSRVFPGLKEVNAARLAEGWDLTIDGEVYEIFSDRHRPSGMLTYPSEREGHVAVLMAYSDLKRRASLERAYADHLRAQEAYENDPRDFVASWQFIDSHPAFWTAYNLEEHPWHWETEGYGSKLRQRVYRDEGGRGVVQLEAGGHVPHATSPQGRAYSEHYGDWRLEVRSQSFEGAILELAFRVSKAFDGEGNDLGEEDFPYSPPAWIKSLQANLPERG